MCIYANLRPQGYYVYQYVDPRTQLPFYIGKGSRKRFLRHLFETADNTENIKKWCYIQGLRNKNLEPIIQILCDNMTQEEAYCLEESLIIKYGRADIDANGILTNICLGQRPPQAKWTDSRRASQGLRVKRMISERKIGGKYEDGYRRTQEAQQQRIQQGTHNLVGDNNPVKKLVAQGLHYWQTTYSNQARLTAGTHPSQQKSTCPHCNKTASIANIKRWHLEHCRLKQ